MWSDRARDGCKILEDLVKRITAGYDVAISNLHHDETSYAFSCEVRRNGWFDKTLICTIDFNDHITKDSISIYSRYPTFDMRINRPATDQEVLAMRGHVENIIHSMKQEWEKKS